MCIFTCTFSGLGKISEEEEEEEDKDDKDEVLVYLIIISEVLRVAWLPCWC